MTNGAKLADAPTSGKSQGDRGYIEKCAVEARQGFQSWRIFYVLVASLALVIMAYIIIAALVPA